MQQKLRAFVNRYQPSAKPDGSLFAHNIPSAYRIQNQLHLSSPSTYLFEVYSYIVYTKALKLASFFQILR